MRYKFNKIRKCPLCHSSKYHVWDRNNNDTIRALGCNECKLVFMDKILSDKDLTEFYNNYNSERDTSNEYKKAQRDKMYKLDYESIISVVPEKGIFLDIGCGQGNFLNYFRNVRKIGYDIDNNAIISGSNRYPDIEFIDCIDPLNDEINCVI